MKRLLLIAIAPAVVALVVAGCGGGSGTNQAGGSGNGNTAASTGGDDAATVSLRKLNVGNALVDAQGRTLYLFEADHGAMSTCNGACASLWPPATTSGKPKAGADVDAAKLGTTKRSNGTLEVTYNGHPLYRYAPDTRPGQDAGQGLNQFGAKWYVLAATGSKIDSD
jgi:predicted lipoprotein with Yx(FWY)xxD motif